MDKPPKIESKEQPRPPRYKTMTREVLEVLPDGDKVEMFLECNGHYHRRIIEQVTYDGEVVLFATTLQQEGLGSCDGKH